MKHIKYHSKLNLSPWRKISLGSWKPKGDSSVYTFEEICVEKVLVFCKNQNITFNSFIIKILALTILKHQRINSVIKFGKIYHRKEISVFCHVLPNLNTDDLTGILIKEAQEKELNTIQNEFDTQLKLIREGNDIYLPTKKNFNYVPAFFSKYLLDFSSFILYNLNLYFKLFSAVKDPFGSVMLTNVGSLGIEKALCPIAPYTKIPMVVSVGKIMCKPLVIDDEIKKTHVATFGFTFDHRIMDGIHFSEFSETFKSYFKAPSKLLKK